ncbi:MAG: FAD-binding domain [Bryobacteraceae bacterium]
MKNQKNLISGAGLAGPTLAYWLLRWGFTPTIVERAPSLRTGGYMIDFWGLGWDVCERMGLVPYLLRDGYKFDEVRLVNSAGRRVAKLDASVYRKVARERFTSILRGDLARAIYSRIDGQVETIFGDGVKSTHQSDDGVEATFEHSSPRTFDLAIGADGLHSAVRAAAFGKESRFEHYLGYRTGSFTVAGYPHREEDYVYVSYCAPRRSVARYSLRDGRTAFLFVYIDPDRGGIPHNVVQQKEILRHIYRGAGWESGAILDAMDSSDDLYLDAVSQIRMEHWSNRRVALIGDAGYCPSLLAGQGSAFAMAGAYLLAHELRAADGDHVRAFARYEAQFKPFVDEKQKGVVWFGGWFAPKTRFGIHARNLATNLMNAPILSTWMAKGFFSDKFHLPPNAA